MQGFSPRVNVLKMLTSGLRAASVGALMSLAACGGVSATSANRDVSEYRVYFLGGQSNMEGFGFVSELSEQQRKPAPRAMIFQGRMAEDGQEGGGIGLWAPLAAGYGTGFSTDGTSNALSDRFGPELSFGQRLSERKTTNKIAIIKYTRGGSALVDGVSGFGSWDPDYAKGNRRNQYDNALTAILRAMAVTDIDGDGRVDRLTPAGILWMQGEADAYNDANAAANYERNLARLIGLLRAAFNNQNLPVVIGRIADSGTTPATQVMKYAPEVQEAQMRFAQSDRCAAIVTVTKDFRFLPDGWHYSSADYVTLGNAFADAVFELEQRCGNAR
jgi:lysophospholipase L1-like esterase